VSTAVPGDGAGFTRRSPSGDSFPSMATILAAIAALNDLSSAEAQAAVEAALAVTRAEPGRARRLRRHHHWPSSITSTSGLAIAGNRPLRRSGTTPRTEARWCSVPLIRKRRASIRATRCRLGLDRGNRHAGQAAQRLLRQHTVGIRPTLSGTLVSIRATGRRWPTPTPASLLRNTSTFSLTTWRRFRAAIVASSCSAQLATYLG